MLAEQKAEGRCAVERWQPPCLQGAARGDLAVWSDGGDAEAVDELLSHFSSTAREAGSRCVSMRTCGHVGMLVSTAAGAVTAPKPSNSNGVSLELKLQTH